MKVLPYEITTTQIVHGGIADPIESVGWSSKGCFYFKHLFDVIEIPEYGDIVQIGCAFGCSLQILYEKFGTRVWGIDPWNPLNHPRIIPTTIQEARDQPLAFVHCNAGDFRTSSALRLEALHWSLRNLVPGGICLTAGHNSVVENHLGWRISDIAAEYACSIRKIPEMIANKTAEKFTESDCLIRKI